MVTKVWVWGEGMKHEGVGGNLPGVVRSGGWAVGEGTVLYFACGNDSYMTLSIFQES